MKREIKFRAWEKAVNTMKPAFKGKMWDFDHIGDIRLDQLNLDKEYIYMQYTSLKDKNGKEIYEGDILSVPHYDKSGVVDKYITLPVVFKEGIFAVQNKIDSAKLHKGLAPLVMLEPTSVVVDVVMLSLCEVIGNIYENPELLK